MQIFVQSIKIGICDTIINGPFIPKHETNKEFDEKSWSSWTETEGKKAQYDCIAKIIITYALSFDKFLRVS